MFYKTYYFVHNNDYDILNVTLYVNRDQNVKATYLINNRVHDILEDLSDK